MLFGKFSIEGSVVYYGGKKVGWCHISSKTKEMKAVAELPNNRITVFGFETEECLKRLEKAYSDGTANHD